PARNRTPVAELGDVTDGVHLAHVPDAHHPLTEHEPGEREAEGRGDHDAGDETVAALSDRRGTPDDAEAALDGGEDGDRHDEDAEATAGDVEVAAGLGAPGGAQADQQDHDEVGRGDRDDGEVHESSPGVASVMIRRWKTA